MNERDRFHKLIRKHPHPHLAFHQRPHATRRQFFRVLGAGVTGYFLGGPWMPSETRAMGSVETKNTAKQVIFVFLEGAPSHLDTLDLKFQDGVTPADFAPETINGVLFPTGLLPNMAQILDKLAIVRSGLSWALAHNLAQTWFQIGRNPTSALGAVAPHFGCVIGRHTDSERRPDQIFPSFIALNAQNAPGAGYFPAEYSPFKTIPSADGLANTDHADGQSRFEQRWDLLQTIDSPLRGAGSPLGDAVAGMSEFYDNARDLMFNPVVEDAFGFTDEESARYGATELGNACLMAKKIVASDQGTRVIQISHRGWDHHQGIYDRNEVNGRDVGNNLYARCGELDPALSTLINDLEADGLLDDTLVLVAGEFGRTPGQLTNDRNGRDHYLQMFYLLAGGGVKGGTVIGETDPTGAFTIEPGWSRFRDIRPEDMEATVLSALGIDWTTLLTDDPFGRGFYYVPEADKDIYGPVHELWG